ncbi:MAG: hypothetical protein FWG75_08080 [Cystobacterineae bacterium]|nr:hypothetical protein [Cystobacterineae bacterium]
MREKPTRVSFLIYLIVIHAFIWCIILLMRYLLPLLFVASAIACGGPSSEPPVDVMVLAPNSNGVFSPQKKRLTTISNIAKLEGNIANFIGNAQMFLDEDDPAQQSARTIEEFKKAIFQNKGSSVRAQFIEKDGALWPADFHSWAMTTAYWNLEQAFLYFQQMYDGRSTKELLELPVYYWLDTNVQSVDPKESSTDNAFYWAGGFRLMGVLPFKDFQTIPMSINFGVMAHEYAHFVFDSRVGSFEARDGLPASLLAAMNEGLADFHAFGATRRLDGKGTVNFLGWTIDMQDAIAARDFSANQCMYQDLYLALHGLPTETFRDEYAAHYLVGTLLASAFYHAAETPEDFDILAKSIINAYSSDDLERPGIQQLYLKYSNEVSLQTVAEVFLSHIPSGRDDLWCKACNQLVGRLQINATCPANCSNYKKPQCPSIH